MQFCYRYFFYNMPKNMLLFEKYYRKCKFEKILTTNHIIKKIVICSFTIKKKVVYFY